MMNQQKPRSPDAAAIMALPYAEHPSFRDACETLASIQAITLEDARELLDFAAANAGFSRLDIEHGGPRNSTVVPFEASSQRNEFSQYGEDRGDVLSMVAMMKKPRGI